MDLLCLWRVAITFFRADRLMFLSVTNHNHLRFVTRVGHPHVAHYSVIKF
ncbi:hypothetical protein Hanom_Chr12g01150331 [Helianthus anomalus]